MAHGDPENPPADIGAWGEKRLLAIKPLAVRARLLEQGGAPLWADFMDELRVRHLGADLPIRTPSVSERLNAVYRAEIDEAASRANAGVSPISPGPMCVPELARR